MDEMQRIRELRYDQLVPADDDVVPRRADDKKIREQTRKSVEDTKRKIRDAFSNSDKVKASIRP
ncbi:hypothetical protein [Rhizobium leguminosarum]|uniref:hypothetical protein n=1 Tax=Rhizobium leguminosarum TaxID=384 RepID=UPI00103FE2BF|nr:hypothetical protein [Rhizobium leguminosarum]TBZ06237.1 hypothetical protein E0H33_34055 [Rhizobium leguminosarum bv. viciae]